MTSTREALKSLPKAREAAGLSRTKGYSGMLDALKALRLPFVVCLLALAVTLAQARAYGADDFVSMMQCEDWTPRTHWEKVAHLAEAQDSDVPGLADCLAGLVEEEIAALDDVCAEDDSATPEESPMMDAALDYILFCMDDE